jgi:membrane protein required for colicin V production
MNWIDIIIVVILILSMISGFTNGLISEVASLAALILGIWGAIRFSSFTAGKLYEYFDMTGKYTGVVSFFITFCIIVVVIHFIGVLATKIADAAALGFFNRILGILFSFLKTILIMSVFFVILNSLDSRGHFLPAETIEHSRFYNPISEIAPSIFPMLKGEDAGRGIDRLKKKPGNMTI